MSPFMFDVVLEFDGHSLQRIFSFFVVTKILVISFKLLVSF